VISSEFQETVTASASEAPGTGIYLEASEEGRVEQIFFKKGSMVKKGDVVVCLSNPDLNLRILTIQSDLAEQENHLRDTKIMMEQQRIELRRQIIQYEYDLIKLSRTYLSNKTLLDKGLIPEQEFLLSKENFELSQQTIQLFREKSLQDSIFRTTQIISLESALKRMQDNIEFVQDKMESLNIKAPVSGQLGSLDAEPGQVVRVGYKIGKINSPDNLKEPPIINQPVILIEKGAFFESTGGQWIYVIDPSSRTAEKRKIKTGRSNSTHYEILEGLQPGEKVIISSYADLGNREKLILK
jgi:HlyD family secretion protein